MKKLVNILSVIFIINLSTDALWAQFTFFTPKENFAIEVSMPNTGLKRLPIYRNSISSLIVTGYYII